MDKCSFQNRVRLCLTIAGILLLSFLVVPSLSGKHHLLASLALAQSASATLSGTVLDEAGAVIPAATVSIVNEGTRFKRETTTNSEGLFTVPLLPPGKYTVTAQRDGFTPVEFKNIILEVGDQLSLRIQMKVGKVGETVTITDNASLTRENAAVGTVVNRQFVENLPLNGRSFQSLITLTPGAVLTKANASEQGQFSVNGQRANANYVMVDGVSANIGVTTSALGQSAGGSVPAFTALGGTNNLVSVDALQEFQIQTSTYAPEFGRTPGAQVSLITRSGTNEFRGALFEYFRNDALDANDYFANRAGLRKPPLRQNDFGLVLGGPVLLPRFGEGGSQPWYQGHDRTFFFFSYEGLRLRQPLVGITNVPSVTARQSAPPQIQPFLNAYPVPNGKDLANGFAEFSASFSNPSTLNATSIRVDHSVGRRLTLFGRYNHSPSETIQRGASGLSLNTLNLSSFTTRTLTAGATLSMTSGLSNDLRVNWSRNEGIGSFKMDSFGGALSPADSLLFPSFASSQDSQFIFFLSGGTNSSFIVGNGVNNEQRQINVVDHLLVTTGAHQLKLGVDYRYLFPVFGPRKYQLQPVFIGVTGTGGAATPGTVASSRASSVTISASDQVSLAFVNFSAFAQDTWKVTPRLTLTYGLRWEYNPPPSGRNGNDLYTVQGLENPTTLSLAPRGTPLYRTTYNNFAPRIGAAFQASRIKGWETVLRGGFGIFHDLGTATAGNAANFFPYARRRTLSISGGVPFPLDVASAAAPAFSFNPPVDQLLVFELGIELPRSYQWNFTLEQALGSSQTLSASYVAAVGRRLLRQDQLRGATLAGNPLFTSSSSVFVVRNTATSDYHALQLKFQRRLSRGLQALASYTWSKSLDISSNDSASNIPGVRVDPRQDRGPSDFDVRHVFSAAATYNLPAPNLGVVGGAVLRDWSMDAMITARSATPVNVTLSRDLGFGRFDVRPDLVSGVPLYLDDRGVAGGRRINNTPVPGNPSQIGPFLLPATARQGTLGRNALRGFPVFQTDLSLRREFRLSERLRLQFRAEFFNVFNHPNFADPQGSLGSASATTGLLVAPNASFGQSTSLFGRSLGSGGVLGGFNPLYQIGGPRSTQLALRFEF